MKPLTAFLRRQKQALMDQLAGPAWPQASEQAPLRPIRRRPHSANSAAGPDMLSIACPDPTAEDALRDQHLAAAQRLVRQENWETLSERIRKADQSRDMTPGCMPVAELMAYGGRADVTLAAEHALLAGRPDEGAPLLAGIESLEHVLAEHADDHIVAAIVAQAHMDIGWAWRGTGWDTEVPDRNREAFAAHFDRAGDILGPFCAQSIDSPLLAATSCALLGGLDDHERRVADRYETLINLNPANPRAMRAMGNHLLPRWYGSYTELELEARRTASRTQDTWGAGGYTWVQFDAISCDDEACANLDLGFFIEGMRDILARRKDSYTVNLLAAYCATGIGQSFSGNDVADQNRSEIAKCARWIVREHMTELHPMIWAHAARGFDNNLRVKSPARFAAAGRDEAMRIITGLFSREIADGQRIVFTDTGAEAVTG
ncbi:hypothetical protein [Sulfitobacter sp. JB4-11]|uniref:hypothetical protein n=1 Tax=Sulfitobacter rhodophyticola TaxID=3238304 RepID=UPI00351899DA